MALINQTRIATMQQAPLRVSRPAQKPEPAADLPPSSPAASSPEGSVVAWRQLESISGAESRFSRPATLNNPATPSLQEAVGWRKAAAALQAHNPNPALYESVY